MRKNAFMAVVSCAILLAAASGAFALVARTAVDPIESGSMAPDYTLLVDAEDYLVDLEGVIAYAEDLLPDQDFLVKRGSDLKWTEWDTPGNAPIDYTKVVYLVNLRLRDLSAFTGGVAGLALSDVTVEGMGDKLPTLVSASLTINGSTVLLLEGGALDASNYVTWVFDGVTGTLSARVTLPELGLTTAGDYNNGDIVSVFVMFKTPVSSLNVTGSEVAFPDYQ